MKKHTSTHPAYIELVVGCNNKLWDKYISLVKQLKEQSLDGTLSEVIRIPVIGWRVQSDANPLERGRRNTYNDYDYDLNYEELYEDDDDDGEITTLPTRVEVRIYFSSFLTLPNLRRFYIQHFYKRSILCLFNKAEEIKHLHLKYL